MTCGEGHMPNLGRPAGASKGEALLQESASDSSTEEEPEDRARALACSSDILSHQCQNRVALEQDGQADAMRQVAGQEKAVQFRDVCRVEYAALLRIEKTGNSGNDGRRLETGFRRGCEDHLLKSSNGVSS